MSESETVISVCAEWRDCIESADPSVWNDERIAGLVKTTKAQQLAYLDRIEAAWKRERDEIVSAVSELKDGMCIHCDLQQQCAEGEDGMPTTCNAMAKVRNFLQRYEKPEVNDGLPF